MQFVHFEQHICYRLRVTNTFQESIEQVANRNDDKTQDKLHLNEMFATVKENKNSKTSSQGSPKMGQPTSSSYLQKRRCKSVESGGAYT